MRRVEEEVDRAEACSASARPAARGFAARPGNYSSCDARSGRRNSDQQREHQQRQQERERGAERDVARHRELALDEVADVHGARAAEQVGRQVGAERGDEDEDAAGHDAGPRQRQRHAPEAPPRRGAEVGGGLEQRAVELLERRVERQDHERQLAVDLAQQHGAVVVQQVAARAARARASARLTQALACAGGTSRRTCAPGSWSRRAGSRAPAARVRQRREHWRASQ